MGRGRAKAKQTRVARDLKYRDVQTDLTQLQRELQRTAPSPNGHSVEPPSNHDDEVDDELYAKYADYAEEDDEDDGEDDGGSHRSHHRRG